MAKTRHPVQLHTFLQRLNRELAKKGLAIRRPRGRSDGSGTGAFFLIEG